ncbi:hypothetical protein FVEN_g5725 [Fusarium venenatum]|nr:hypothetical protein FVEN_g5725 [Fusarium venenatum]
MLSATYGNTLAISKLVDKGENINETNRRRASATPLHMASVEGHTVCVENLLQLNAQVDVRTSYQQTPLHWAAENGEAAIADLLIEHRANVNATNKGGGTALTEAVLNRHRGLVNIFVGEGATINGKEIQIAEKKYEYDLAMFLRRTLSLQQIFKEHIPVAWARLIWKASLGRLLRKQGYNL